MMWFSEDPASLDCLHDIVLPPAVRWWPPAPGWYALVAIAVVLFALITWTLIERWLRNRYRRAALAELTVLESKSKNVETLNELAELVKRVALAAFPRERVASLSGAEWLAFLDSSGGTQEFTSGAGQILEDGYRSADARVDAGLIEVVRHWIRKHREIRAEG